MLLHRCFGKFYGSQDVLDDYSSLDVPWEMTPLNSFILQYLFHNQFFFLLKSESIKLKNICQFHNLQEWDQNPRNCKSLFQQIFIVYKTFTVGIKIKNLPGTIRSCLWLLYKDVYKTTTCPIEPLLTGSKSSCLLQVLLHLGSSIKIRAKTRLKVTFPDGDMQEGHYNAFYSLF